MTLRPPPYSVRSAWRGDILGMLIGLRDRVRAVGVDDRSLVFTSWWRSPAENARVGGDPRSQHLLGLALDVVPVEGTLAQLASVLRGSPAYVVVLEPDHVHLQRFSAGRLPASAFNGL